MVPIIGDKTIFNFMVKILVIFHKPCKSHFVIFSLNKSWVSIFNYLIIFILGLLAKDVDWATIKDFDEVEDVEENENSVFL